jgi:hypothetical protein
MIGNTSLATQTVNCLFYFTWENPAPKSRKSQHRKVSSCVLNSTLYHASMPMLASSNVPYPRVTSPACRSNSCHP